MCQCPLGLVTHFYMKETEMNMRINECVNALSGL